MANPVSAKNPNSNRANQFGTLPMSPDKQWLQVENYFIPYDATSGTAQNSPLSVASNADTLLVVPQGATKVLIYSSVALRISDASPASAPYFVIPAATLVELPCATPTNEPANHSGTLYLRGDAGAATVQFLFKCV